MKLILNFTDPWPLITDHYFQPARHVPKVTSAPAAKPRKNAAPGASRGVRTTRKRQSRQGERRLHIHLFTSFLKPQRRDPARGKLVWGRTPSSVRRALSASEGEPRFLRINEVRWSPRSYRHGAVIVITFSAKRDRCKSMSGGERFRFAIGSRKIKNSSGSAASCPPSQKARRTGTRS